MRVKNIVYKCLKETPFFRDLFWGIGVYRNYSRQFHQTKKAFVHDNFKKFYVTPYRKNKGKQIQVLLTKIDVVQSESNLFFYSLDCFKGLKTQKQMLINYTIDYKLFVDKSLQEIISFVRPSSMLEESVSDLYRGIQIYIQRLKQNQSKI